MDNHRFSVGAALCDNVIQWKKGCLESNPLFQGILPPLKLWCAKPISVRNVEESPCDRVVLIENHAEPVRLLLSLVSSLVRAVPWVGAKSLVNTNIEGVEVVPTTVRQNLRVVTAHKSVRIPWKSVCCKFFWTHSKACRFRRRENCQSSASNGLDSDKYLQHRKVRFFWFSYQHKMCCCVSFIFQVNRNKYRFNT